MNKNSNTNNKNLLPISYCVTQQNCTVVSHSNPLDMRHCLWETSERLSHDSPATLDTGLMSECSFQCEAARLTLDCNWWTGFIFIQEHFPFCILPTLIHRQDLHGLTLHICVGLDKNGPRRLMYLKAWFPVHGLLGRIRRYDLSWKRYITKGCALGFQKCTPVPRVPLSACCLQIRMWL